MIQNILIIDDSIEIQILLRMLLESKGYHIDCTSNGEEALNLLSLCHKLPDMILLDLQMPVMDGLRFLDISGKDKKLKDIPIVLMSGDDDIRGKKDMSEVADVLQKPFSVVSVMSAVERNAGLH